ncbi:hypothetical protein MIV002R [Invertebrate iridescent virus 3]|uniref:Uncharacterized protein 002R n=1 Tax=Invertebrate iridescent virus 3 TaxID=345201 RepID=002R_IIV3|nr:hypothetical protein MIV002R [Invertebrate iridescent virus 3]Q197F8.1 RecName: Full=Uncharacterized protein 002R [Invertebrate iridescent virus 3]ABF82032.1 hypothetical protein MIV002R [Invertebrate iridescent virus 3]
MASNTVSAQGGSNRPVRDFSNIQDVAQFLLFDPIWNEQPGSIVPWKMNREQALAERYPELQTSEPSEDYSGPVESLELLPLEIKLDIMQYLSWEQISWCKHPWLWTRWYKDNVVRVSAITFEDFQREYAFPEKIQEIHFTDTRAEEIKAILETTPNVTRLVIRRIDDMNYNTHGDLGLDDLEFLTHLMVEDACGFTDFWAPSLTHLTIKNLDMHPRWFGPVMDGIKSMQSTLKYLYIFETYGVNKPFVQWCTDNIETFYCTNSYRYENVPRPIYVWVLFQEDEWHGYRVEDNKFHRRYMYSTILHKRDTDWVENNPLKTPAQVEMYKFLLRISQLNRDGTGYESDSDPENEHFDDESFSSGEEDSSDEDDPTWAPDSDDSDWETETEEEPSVAARILEKGKLTITNLMKSLGFKPKPKKIQSIDRYFCSLDSNYNSEDEDFEYDSDSEDDDSDSEDDC